MMYSWVPLLESKCLLASLLVYICIIYSECVILNNKLYKQSCCHRGDRRSFRFSYDGRISGSVKRRFLDPGLGTSISHVQESKTSHLGCGERGQSIRIIRSMYPRAKAKSTNGNRNKSRDPNNILRQSNSAASEISC